MCDDLPLCRHYTPTICNQEWMKRHCKKMCGLCNLEGKNLVLMSYTIRTYSLSLSLSQSSSHPHPHPHIPVPHIHPHPYIHAPHIHPHIHIPHPHPYIHVPHPRPRPNPDIHIPIVYFCLISINRNFIFFAERQ